MERVFRFIVAFALVTIAVVSPTSAVQVAAQLGRYAAGAHCRESPYQIGRKLVGRPVTDIFVFTPTVARPAGWLYTFRAHISVIQLGAASQRDEVAKALSDVGDTTAAGFVATDRGVGIPMSSWPPQPNQVHRLIARGVLSVLRGPGRPSRWAARVVSVSRPRSARRFFQHADRSAESVRQLSGHVWVTVSLDAQSRVRSLDLVPTSSAPLDAAALAIARRSTYRTGLRDCIPVVSKYTLFVTFPAGQPVSLAPAR